MNTLSLPKLLLLAALAGAAPTAPVWAQAAPAALAPAPATGAVMPLSLSQAVGYAVQNKSTLLATRLGEQTARARVGEIKSAGLPQVNVGATVADNFKLQKNLVDFSRFGGAPLRGATLTAQDVASAQAGAPVTLAPTYGEVPQTGPTPLAFGLQYAGSAAASVSQLLFDGSYLIGLKAAKVYEQLAQKQTQQAEIDVAEQVSKAYYSTLVARARLALLGRNVQRLDTVLNQTQKIYRPALPKSSTWTASACSATTWWWSSRKPSASPS